MLTLAIETGGYATKPFFEESSPAFPILFSIADVALKSIAGAHDSRISLGDPENDTNNNEGEKGITEKEKEAQLAKKKQEEEG